jgi:hypothetical protein
LWAYAAPSTTPKRDYRPAQVVKWQLHEDTDHRVTNKRRLPETRDKQEETAADYMQGYVGTGERERGDQLIRVETTW